jgi:hypothetical protein
MSLEIIDYFGATKAFDIHPFEQLVAFEQGNSLLLWDLIMDKKVKMHSHDHEIETLIFCGKRASLIASVSGGLQVQLFVSEWETLTRMHSVYLPSKHRRNQVQSVFI